MESKSDRWKKADMLRNGTKPLTAATADVFHFLSANIRRTNWRPDPLSRERHRMMNERETLPSWSSRPPAKYSSPTRRCRPDKCQAAVERSKRDKNRPWNADSLLSHFDFAYLVSLHFASMLLIATCWTLQKTRRIWRCGPLCAPDPHIDLNKIQFKVNRIKFGDRNALNISCISCVRVTSGSQFLVNQLT